MALFLIYDRNNSHPDPFKEVRGCYKLGDIVEVLDDAHPVVPVIQPPWYIIRVNGVTKAQALQYMEPYLDPSDPTGKTILRRRKFNVDFAILPQAVRDALNATRYYEVDWSTVRNFVRNKMTGGTA